MKAGERAAGLTRQLLAFSRRQALQTRIVELNKLVTSLAGMLQRLIGEDIELNLKLGSDLGRVTADPGQMEQVIMNLVVNARDAMENGGAVTIETTNVMLDKEFTSKYIGVKSGPYVLLCVSDTGSGMDDATKARLFEPFFTTKTRDKGTGLGLSTVFGIVKQSGGTVEVFSEPGKGTSVGVYLPRIDQPASVESAALKVKMARGSETILVVEDDEMVRGLVRETLVRHGYHVLDAADPADAMRKADAYSGPLQLLITDVILPKTNGRELAQLLVGKHPEMRVLYMSGYTDQVVINSGIQHADVAFLQKPFTPNGLAEKVREVLEPNGSNKNRTRRASE
jgi:CheY-like chemotaxis protein